MLPVEAANAELDDAEQAAAAIRDRIPLGETAPDLARVEARGQADLPCHSDGPYNAKTALAQVLDGHYARAGGEACPSETLTTSSDIQPSGGQLLIPAIRRPAADPPRPAYRTQANPGDRRPLRLAQPSLARYPRTDLHPQLRRSNLTPALYPMNAYLYMSGPLKDQEEKG